MSERNQGRPWQAHEDAQLTHAIANHCGDIDWKEIAKHVPGRTNKACRKRWLHSLCPTVKKTAWTKEEDDTLLSLHEHHGPKWSLIARHIVGRTDDACSKRYREALDPNLKKDDWTMEEDTRLLELYVSMGGKWMQVGQQMGRSSLGCRNRWRLLERKRLSGKPSTTDASPLGDEPRPTASLDLPFIPTAAVPPDGAFNGNLPDSVAIFNDPPPVWEPPGFFWDPHFVATLSYPTSPMRNGESSQRMHLPLSSSTSAPPDSLQHPSYEFDAPFESPVQQPSAFMPSASYLQPQRQSTSAAAADQSQQHPLDEHVEVDPRETSTSENHQVANNSIGSLSHDRQGSPSPARESLSSPAVPLLDFAPPSSPVEMHASTSSRQPTPPSSNSSPSRLQPSSRHASSSSSPSTSPDAVPASTSALPPSISGQSEPTAQPFLSSSLPADSDVLAYACGFPNCWETEGSGARVCFATSKELGDHMREVHQDDISADGKPFRCALSGCKRSWKSLNGLQYHLQVSKVHFRQALAATPALTSDTSKRPKKIYPCTLPHCLNVYKQASGLRYHLKHGHPSEVPAQLTIVPPSLARKIDGKLQRATSATVMLSTS